MPRFLAVDTMKPEDLAFFRSLPKAEQDVIDAVGLQQWTAWENRNAKFIRDRGGMGGQNDSCDQEGISKALNPLCGYLVVEGETAEEAARLFEDHPYITVCPGDGVNIMLLLS